MSGLLEKERERILFLARGGELLFATIPQIFGVPGIGVSHFLQKLAGFARRINMATSYVDLIGLDWPVLEKRLCQNLGAKGSLTEWFSRRVKTRKPVVLLFDSTDRASPLLVAEIEEKVLVHCVSGRVLVYLGGRSPLHLRRFDLRRRVIEVGLPSLSAEETAEQLGDSVSRTAEIHNASYGYPPASAVTAKMIRQGSFDHGAALKAIVEEEILPRLASNKELWPLVLVASTFRYLDAALLRAAGEASGKFPDVPRDAWGGYLGLLHTMQVVRWQAGRGGHYYVADPIRKLLQDYLKEHYPQLFETLHRAAEKKFEEWVGRTELEPRLRVILRREARFHTSQLGR